MHIMVGVRGCLLLAVEVFGATTTPARCATTAGFRRGCRTVTGFWRNTGDKTAEADIRARIIQTSSATAIPLVDAPWKKLEVLPRQTVLESAQLDFPP